MPGLGSIVVDLRGDTSVLTSTDVPTDLDTWNAFTQRTLLLPAPSNPDASTGIAGIGAFPEIQVIENPDDRNVKEDVDPTASGNLIITDADEGEDAFQPVDAAEQEPSNGGFGTYTMTAGGAWTYTLDNANPAVQALSEGEVLADSIDVVSFDGTVTTTVSITITGTDETGPSNGINLAASYNIVDILAGTTDLDGFVINGIDANDLSGQSISGAGDVNGDLIDDFIIGANTADPDNVGTPGQAYVVFGSASGLPADLELSALNGTNGFAINGVVQNGQIGLSVSALAISIMTDSTT